MRVIYCGHPTFLSNGESELTLVAYTNTSQEILRQLMAFDERFRIVYIWFDSVYTYH